MLVEQGACRLRRRYFLVILPKQGKGMVDMIGMGAMIIDDAAARLLLIFSYYGCLCTSWPY